MTTNETTNEWIKSVRERAHDYLTDHDTIDEAAHDFADWIKDLRVEDLAEWLRTTPGAEDACDKSAAEVSLPAEAGIVDRLQGGQYVMARDIFLAVRDPSDPNDGAITAASIRAQCRELVLFYGPGEIPVWEIRQTAHEILFARLGREPSDSLLRHATRLVAHGLRGLINGDLRA